MLSDQITTARLAFKIRRHSSPGLNEAVSRVEASIEPAVAKLWRKVEAAYRENPASAAKYARPHRWFLLNTLRMAELGLHNSSGLRVLDIGCGPGYFVALARALGHDCYGVDAPASYLTDVEREVYASLLEALGCSPVVSPLLIERFKPLPFREQPFDLITALWICFNRHGQADEWGVDEWKFFVQDAYGCLRPGGRIVLDLNENRDRYAELRFYDAATRDYFRSVGDVQQGRVVLTRG